MAEAILLILIHSHMNRYHNSFALSEKRQVLQIIVKFERIIHGTSY